MSRPIKKLALKPAAPSGHVCTPHAVTVEILRDGSRSSVRETCSCGIVSTYILLNTGAIEALRVRA